MHRHLSMSSDALARVTYVKDEVLCLSVVGRRAGEKSLELCCSWAVAVFDLTFLF